LPCGAVSLWTTPLGNIIRLGDLAHFNVEGGTGQTQLSPNMKLDAVPLPKKSTW